MSLDFYRGIFEMKPLVCGRSSRSWQFALVNGNNLVLTFFISAIINQVFMAFVLCKVAVKKKGGWFDSSFLEKELLISGRVMVDNRFGNFGRCCTTETSCIDQAMPSNGALL